MLTKDGGYRFGEVTRDNLGQRLAIVLDGELYSAPVIQGAIETGNGQITGHFTDQEAFELANVLQNPLRAPLSIVSSEDVDPTLGKDSIRSGILASVYAIIFVSLFMLGYYRIAGMAANIALVTNIIILLGVMCSIGTTLTLPGIAGVVLTIGMAVDANVLIYERLREELAKGKSLRGAIAAGYARAFGTIFDSHVTTLISSVILIFMGTGPIKGFGVTLTIGVAASLFTSLVVTRLIFNFLLDRNLITSLPMVHLIKSAKVNFMKLATPLFILTWTFIVVGAGLRNHRPRRKNVRHGLFGRRQHHLRLRAKTGCGADPFRAHRRRRKRCADPVSKERGCGHGNPARNDRQRHVEKSAAGARRGFPQAGFKPSSEQNVGATIGLEIQRSAIIASLLSLFGILIYVAFRYEFSFAVAAVVAVIHDVLLTIGCYCIANATSGREFNATVVAAVLTIIGFSINDKIVIFDRIREDLKLGARGTFQGNHQPGAQSDLEPHDHHFRHGVSGDDVAVYFRWRRHQRLCVHLPHRHHHRDLFLHLHRQRNRVVVAQRRASEHRCVAGDAAKCPVGEGLIFLRNLHS